MRQPKRISLYSTKDITLATVLVYRGSYLVAVKIEVKSLQPLRTEATFVVGVPTTEDLERLLALYMDGKLAVEPRKYDQAKAEVVARMRMARRSAIKEAKDREQGRTR